MNSTLASLALALFVALTLGPLLSRIATQWFSGLGLVRALTELRGAFLPYLLVLSATQLGGLSPWVAVGVVIGVSQAVSLSRWTTRRAGDWSRALIGGLALGRSRAALLSALTLSRGAVVATLATTLAHVVLLEAVLTALALPGSIPHGSVGANLWTGTRVSALIFLVLGTGLLLGTELLCGLLLRGRGSATVRGGDSKAAPEHP